MNTEAIHFVAGAILAQNTVLPNGERLKLSLLTTDQSTGQPRLRSKHWMAFPVHGKFSSRRTEA